MCLSDFVTFLLLKPLIEEDPDEAETKTGSAASRKQASTPGCWTAAKVTLRLLFYLTRWKIQVTPTATPETTSIQKWIYVFTMNLAVL